jgi:hypothetical protein
MNQHAVEGAVQPSMLLPASLQVTSSSNEAASEYEQLNNKSSNRQQGAGAASS